MVRSTVNEKFDFIIEKIEDQFKVNGEFCDIDTVKTDETSFHIIHKNTSYNVRLLSWDKAQKKLEIKINRNHYSVKLDDEGDLLLEKAGIPVPIVQKIDALIAPMPGLISDIKVRVGDAVKAGDPLVVLKAMKMENVLKSPHDGIIREILAEKNQKIEKDSVIIQF